MSQFLNVMTREEILAGLKQLEPWFQAIELGPGIVTKVKSVAGEPEDHPKGEWQVIRNLIPADLSGKSLLDVGCNAGFFSVEAKRRGAKRVLGVDSQRLHIRQACFVRNVLRLDIEFRRMSVYDLASSAIGQFDITFALGLLYHCKHLVQALENLFYITREMLVLETAVYPVPATLRSLISQLGLEAPDVARGRATHLLAYVENPPEAKEAVYNWFLPTLSSMTALLKNVGFSDVAVHPYNDRAVYVCRKDDSCLDSRSLNGLGSHLTLEYGQTECHPNELIRFCLRIENTGSGRWIACRDGRTDKGTVNLGVHLLRANGEEVAWDFARGTLGQDVLPGHTTNIELMIPAPNESGSFLLEFDMVSEHLTWFEDLGSIPLRHELSVK